MYPYSIYLGMITTYMWIFILVRVSVQDLMLFARQI